MIRKERLALFATMLLATPVVAVLAEPHGGGAHMAYPGRGSAVRVLPRGAYGVGYRDRHYWYHGGVWYAPWGPRWIVVAPPFGVFVPVLPGFYTTLWFGGLPYYYANDVYYLWRPERNAYEVVPPPEGAGSELPGRGTGSGPRTAALRTDRRARTCKYPAWPTRARVRSHLPLPPAAEPPRKHCAQDATHNRRRSHGSTACHRTIAWSRSRATRVQKRQRVA